MHSIFLLFFNCWCGNHCVHGKLNYFIVKSSSWSFSPLLLDSIADIIKLAKSIRKGWLDFLSLRCGCTCTMSFFVKLWWWQLLKNSILIFTFFSCSHVCCEWSAGSDTGIWYKWVKLFFSQIKIWIINNWTVIVYPECWRDAGHIYFQPLLSYYWQMVE